MSSSKVWVRVLCVLGLAAGASCGDDGIHKLPDAAPFDSSIDSPPAQPGLLKLTPVTADFGSVVLGQTSVNVMVTVGNVGFGPTGSISAAISGGMGSNFLIGAMSCTTLAPAATCTIAVTFVPTSAGSKNAMLAVTSAPGGTVMTALTGVGIAPGALSITPSTSSFGDLTVGSVSAPATTYTVTNTGGVATGTLTTTAGGSNPGEFTKSNDLCNGQSLPANGTCTFAVRFAPQSAGVKFGSFVVSGNPGGAVATSVTGNALAPAQLFANPTSQNFGSVVLTATSPTITFNIVNIGGVPTAALVQALSGPDVGDFTIVSSNCSGAVLNPNSACQILARFAPTTVGQKTASIALTSTGGASATLSLSGTGIAAGQLVITPSTNPYPGTIVGAVSAPASFTVTNTGGATSGPIAVNLGGTNAGQFSVTGTTCQGQTLATNATCTISVAFAPNTTGAKSASLFAAASPGGTGQSALSGNGLPAAQLTMTPATKDFGSVGTGGQTQFQVFTIQNLGGTTSTTPMVTLGGMNIAQFMMITDCTAPLAPFAACTASVRFQPVGIGNYSASLLVTATQGGSATSSLFGQGVNPAALSVNPSSLPFPGITTIGDTSIPLSFTVTNNGGTATGPLVVASGGANPADFTIAGTTCGALAPQASCTVTVTFAPVARGARSASINVSGSPGGSVSVAATGDALPRLEIIDVNGDTSIPPVDPFDFGNVTTNLYFYWFHVGRITVRNNTDLDQVLNLTSVFGAPANYALYYLSCGGGGGKGSGSGSGNQLLPGGGINTIFAHDTCEAGVLFQPQTTGVKPGSILFDIGAGVLNQAALGLTGRGINELEIIPDPTNDFGNIALGQTSGDLRFRVQSNFEGDWSGPISIATLQSQRFTIDSEDCSGVSLGFGQSCFIYVNFSPTLLGPDAVVLSVTANPGGDPSTDVHGTGVDPNNLIFNPSPLNFGDVFSGSTSDKVLTVLNPAGAQTSGVISFALQDDSCTSVNTFAPGTISAPCYEILAPVAGDCASGVTALVGGSSCTLHVRFTPPLGDFSSSSAQIHFDAAPGTGLGGADVGLFGRSVSTLKIAPVVHDFGLITSAQTLSKVFTVTNVSPLGQVVSLVNLTGSTTDLSLTSTCGVLLPNTQCQVTVSFDATASALVSANLRVRTGTNSGIANAAVLGNRLLPTSCQSLHASDPAAPSGSYSIDIDGYGATRQALTVDCDMLTDGGGYTALPLNGGISTFARDEANSCQALGLDLAVARTHSHLDALMSQYGLGYFQTVPGVYGLGAGDYTNCSMSSTDSVCGANWKAIDGGAWFARSIPYGEPNGDYTAECWLGTFGSDVNGLIFNDGGCGYETGTSYVCSTNDK